MGAIEIAGIGKLDGKVSTLQTQMDDLRSGQAKNIVRNFILGLDGEKDASLLDDYLQDSIYSRGWRAVLSSPDDLGMIFQVGVATKAVFSSPVAMGDFADNKKAMDLWVADSGLVERASDVTVAVEAISSSDVAMGVLASDSTAMNTFASNPSVLDLLEASPVATAAIASSKMAAGKYIAGQSGLDPTSYSDLSAITKDSSAMEAASNSQEAMDMVASNSGLMEAVLSSSAAVTALDNTSPIKVPEITEDDPRVIFSGQHSSNHAFRAFDRNASNTWAQRGLATNGAWVGWEFDNPVWCYKVEFRNTNVNLDNPDGVVIEGADSVDGEWEEAAAITLGSSSSLFSRTMETGVGRKKFWRLRTTRGTVNEQYGFSILQFYCK
ncbi:hypothetical protein [Vreelandella jeotgali]|uniref:hypothetical protein n=1 Tax=Vreelandella jeotgali TaxID=553386 RepID=UPI00037CBB98|nr:hypothetical protein [Halomonas jeotgali]